MKTVGVDIDGVLLNTPKLFLKVYNSKYGTNFKISDLTDYLTWKVLGCSEEEVWQIYNDIAEKGLWLKAELMDKRAVKEFKKLKKKGYRIKIITSSSPESLEQKLRRLVESGLIFDDYKLTETRNLTSKAEYAKDYEYIIEDSPYQCKAIHEAGGKAIIYDLPHNRIKMPEGVIRVHNWNEVKKIILKKN